jgi:hypothetical protein
MLFPGPLLVFWPTQCTRWPNALRATMSSCARLPSRPERTRRCRPLVAQCGRGAR